ncbi:DUF1554 domain-containing protein [Candidatus Marimicrobium litorale]|uniref:Bacterial repeat domain-containing protein n=1 Tax=Candidatus Marimicrobium litorale TaxID=2518991 RepID=A0ABT3T297_9GAMM|nr:DUF1554 domain-containing protein [Candidatus Marimicrobium litorale]MCX2976373.1 hypothetical protein [Candidatus Marimicrobium litorale]
MNGLSIKALLIISLAMLATGCKLALTVTSGGDVTSLSGNRDCAGGSLCEYEVTDTSFIETFTAVPRPGYVFSKWQGSKNYLCPDSTNPTCTISTAIIDTLVEPERGIADTVLASGTIYYAQPLFTFVGVDTDEDGIKDYLDPDDDNDGVLDADDNCPLEGPNLDGFGCPIAQSKTVFVTSESYTGNLGGLAGADQKCNDLAAAASLSGEYKAWLSDGIEAPNTRFTQSPYVSYTLVDGTVIAVGYEDLIAPQPPYGGPFTDGLLAPINLTELGTTKNASVFTNTNADGPAVGPEGGFQLIPGSNEYLVGSCLGFTSSTDEQATFGRTTGSAYLGFSTAQLGWLPYVQFVGCTSPSALFCFEQ